MILLGAAGRNGPCSRHRSHGETSREYSSMTISSGWASSKRGDSSHRHPALPAQSCGVLSGMVWLATR